MFDNPENKGEFADFSQIRRLKNVPLATQWHSQK
jgi:hypothetical protein